MGTNEPDKLKDLNTQWELNSQWEFKIMKIFLLRRVMIGLIELCVFQ